MKFFVLMAVLLDICKVVACNGDRFDLHLSILHEQSIGRWWLCHLRRPGRCTHQVWRPAVLRVKAFMEILQCELSICERQMFCHSRSTKNKKVQLTSKCEINFS